MCSLAAGYWPLSESSFGRFGRFGASGGSRLYMHAQRPCVARPRGHDTRTRKGLRLGCATVVLWHCETATWVRRSLLFESKTVFTVLPLFRELSDSNRF